MAKSSASVIASKSKMEARLVAAKAELAAAQSTEVFHDGQYYTVVIGAPGQKEEHQGLLLGQFENDKGVLKLRFQVGSGMNMRVLDLSTSAVKVEATPVYDAEGKEIKVRSSAVISSIIAKIERRLASFDADLAEALERETLEVGKVYTIRVGRGDTRREIQAVLYAQAQTEQGTKLRFFAGEGFEAAFYDGTPAMVVLDSEVPEDTDEDLAAADAAEAAAIEAEANAEVSAEVAAE